MGADTVQYFRRSKISGDWLGKESQNWKARLLTDSPYAVCFCQLNRLGNFSVKSPTLRRTSLRHIPLESPVSILVFKRMKIQATSFPLHKYLANNSKCFSKFIVKTDPYT